MESKLLNYSKTPIPVLVSSPSPSYEIMQSLLSKSGDLATSLPLSSSSSPIKSFAKTHNNSSNNHHHKNHTIIHATSSSHHNSHHDDHQHQQQIMSTATSNAASKRFTKKQEKSFIRNTINLINNHSSRTIAKDLVLSATRKHKAAHRAQRNLLISENSHLGMFISFLDFRNI